MCIRDSVIGFLCYGALEIVGVIIIIIIIIIIGGRQLHGLKIVVPGTLHFKINFFSYFRVILTEGKNNSRQTRSSALLASFQFFVDGIIGHVP